MRVGSNPEKNNFVLNIENYHRVIIPVYIPNFEGYFKDSLEIFKLCLQSLLLTVHSKTRITLYNNASHYKVKQYLDELYQKNELIDQVIHSKKNLGKINAFLSGSKGNLEPLITISDADVFFKSGWQAEVEKLLIDFPEAGMVSPVPSSKAFKSFVDANWYYGIVKGKIRFKEVLDPDGMMNFDKSLGRDQPLYNKLHLQKYLTISSKKSEAVMGCGHFLATLRREVFDKGTSEPAQFKIDGDIEYKFIDLPNQNLGYLRLATLGNYAYHLGNIHENWMDDEMDKLKKTSTDENIFQASLFYHSKPLNQFELMLGKTLRRVLLSRIVRPIYFRLIGLPKSKEY